MSLSFWLLFGICSFIVINIFTRKNQIDTMKVFAMNTFHYKKQFFALYSNT